MEHKRCFLNYTAVGNITSRAELTYNAIEIEFADMHTHRPVRFNDYSGFTMAAMNLEGAVFASPEVPSLSFSPFSAPTISRSCAPPLFICPMPVSASARWCRAHTSWTPCWSCAIASCRSIALDELTKGAGLARR